MVHPVRRTVTSSAFDHEACRSAIGPWSHTIIQGAAPHTSVEAKSATKMEKGGENYTEVNQM